MLKHVLRLFRHHLRAGILMCVLFLALLWLLLPIDSRTFLYLRWHFNSLTGTMVPDDRWISQPALFPIGTEDVAILVKTGFSTQGRLEAMLNATISTRSSHDVVLVGDYRTSFWRNGVDVHVHDALAWMIKRDKISRNLNVSRLEYYTQLTAAIAAGERELALTIGETHGWELDIMKASSILMSFHRDVSCDGWILQHSSKTLP